jgi:hypothetical protein
MVMRPPGARSVRFVKLRCLMVISDSMVEIPVSLAPTTIIRLFTDYFGKLRDFLEIMLKAKRASY